MLENSAPSTGVAADVVSAARTALAALLALGCGEATTSTRNARPMKANMSVSATISSQSATQVLLVALYSSVPLDSFQLSQLDGPVAAGRISACSSSTSRARRRSRCPCRSTWRTVSPIRKYLEMPMCARTSTSRPFCSPARTRSIPTIPPDSLRLNGNNLLDVDFVGPFSVSLNATATTPRALVLHEVQSIDVSPTRLSLQIGQTSSLTATVLDLYDKPVAGRTVHGHRGTTSSRRSARADW